MFLRNKEILFIKFFTINNNKISLMNFFSFIFKNACCKLISVQNEIQGEADLSIEENQLKEFKSIAPERNLIENEALAKELSNEASPQTNIEKLVTQQINNEERKNHLKEEAKDIQLNQADNYMCNILTPPHYQKIDKLDNSNKDDLQKNNIPKERHFTENSVGISVMRILRDHI